MRSIKYHGALCCSQKRPPEQTPDVCRSMLDAKVAILKLTHVLHVASKGKVQYRNPNKSQGGCYVGHATSLSPSSPPDYYQLSDTRVYCFYVYHVTAYYIYVDYIVLDPIAHGFVPITWSLWVSGWKGSETRSALQVLGKGTLYLLWQAPIAGVVVFEHVIVSQVMSDCISEAAKLLIT